MKPAYGCSGSAGSFSTRSAICVPSARNSCTCGSLVALDQLSTYTLALRAKLPAWVPGSRDSCTTSPPASGTTLTCISSGASGLAAK